ncbi:hypothetical protein ACHAPT_009040 [Fusarium lateritium]
MPSEFIRCRARQLQRYANAKPPLPYTNLITKEHLLRAANLEKYFSLYLSPDDELQWPPNWASNSLSLVSFLRCRSWISLRVPAEPMDDVVGEEITVKNDQDVDLAENTDEVGGHELGGAEKDDKKSEPIAEHNANKPSQASGIEQNAAATLMAFRDRGSNDSPVEEIPRDRPQHPQPRPVPRSDAHFAPRATHSTYYAAQHAAAFAFPQAPPPFAVPGYGPYGMPYPAYPPPFTPVVAVAPGYPVVQMQMPGYFPPYTPVFEGFRPQPALAFAPQGYGQPMMATSMSRYSQVDAQHYVHGQHHPPPPASGNHHRQF